MPFLVYCILDLNFRDLLQSTTLKRDCFVLFYFYNFFLLHDVIPKYVSLQMEFFYLILTMFIILEIDHFLIPPKKKIKSIAKWKKMNRLKIRWQKNNENKREVTNKLPKQFVLLSPFLK